MGTSSAFVIPPPAMTYPNIGGSMVPSDPTTMSRTDTGLCSSVTDDQEDSSTASLFSMDTALFCAGLAFDAYSEPADSSRWERGPQGLSVAFQSDAFTRSLYNGLLEVTPVRVSDLPDEDDTAESVLSGGGVDAYLLVAVAEGHVTPDVELLTREKFHRGVLDLQGSAHAGRSNTAWSNVNEKQSKKKRSKGGSGAYHVKSSWTKGGAAVWENDPPFYLYVQTPATANLVFTVVDEDVVGEDMVIGSTHRRLTKLLPNAGRADPLEAAKAAVLERMANNNNNNKELSPEELRATIGNVVAQEWRGTLPLDVIPRKKDKGGQMAMGAMAGAMVAGPAGAAVGGLVGNLFEGIARGKLDVRLRYLPVPEAKPNRKKYAVKGGLPGVDWGDLYRKRLRRSSGGDDDEAVAGDDLELCVSVLQEKTGCSCAVYRSLEKKLIAVSFRGTCAPVDLITDASIVQTAWVEGVDITDDNDKEVAKVHVGFRSSLNSVSRRVKELILAAVAPGESLADYSLVITGHSLGGALATLFATDVAEYGMDAGRGLPQLEPSEPWWNVVGWAKTKTITKAVPPPRPKDIRLYSFGSPRVGNDVFVNKFEGFVKDGTLKEAYRVVNGEDVVTRLPRTVNALGMVKVGYEHSGSTALISLPKIVEGTTSKVDVQGDENPLIWIEGESDNSKCPVRDGTTFVSPLADGSLLGDLVGAVKDAVDDNDSAEESSITTSSSPVDAVSKLGAFASKLGSSVSGRIKNVDANDLMSVLGIERQYVDREAKIFSSILSGDAIGNHMEDQYYLAMGRACGYIALVGEEIRELEPSQNEGGAVDV